MRDSILTVLIVAAPVAIGYAVAFLIIWGRRFWHGRPDGDDMADRERELMDRVRELEARQEALIQAALKKQADADYWRESSARHSELASESLKIISDLKNDLKRENEAMARKPLTEAQLKECLDSGGTTCPRCGDDDNLTVEDITADETDIGIYFQDVSCSGCNEPFRLVFTLTKVESIED